MIRVILVFLYLYVTLCQDCTHVQINWNTVIAVSKTITTLQVVTNPILNPSTSPIAATAFQHLADLDADLVRFAAWFPYPKIAVAELDPPMNGKTSWNFDSIEPQFRAFMNATYGKGHNVLPNFCTQPTWMYDPAHYDYPVDPNQVDWGYPRGPAVGKPNTTQLVSEYYGRLLSWMINGQFTDEFGVIHKNMGEKYQLTHWEVFNEPESEHQFNVEEYTIQYDAIVREVRRVADPNHRIQFVGLALSGREVDWIKYFLDPKNHHPEALPITYISFHFYASSNSRTDPDSYEQFFPSADGFLVEAKTIVELRDQMSPDTKIDCDEMGVILPDDNDPNAPIPPPIYWNAAGAMFAYLYGKMAVLGYDVLGESQFAGCPVIPEWDIHDSQYPSVSLLNWTTGVGNARYWVLHLLIHNFGIGDKFVDTRVVIAPETVFCADVPTSIGTAVLTCVDPMAVINEIQFVAYGTPTGACGNYVRSTCDAKNVTDYVKAKCLGKNNCTILSFPTFGDPCFGVVKKFVIQATCSGTQGGTGTPAENIPPFAQAIINAKTGIKKTLFVNTKNKNACITLDGVVGSTIFTVDEATGDGPARKDTLSSDKIVLAPYAVAVLYN